MCVTAESEIRPAVAVVTAGKVLVAVAGVVLAECLRAAVVVGAAESTPAPTLT
jgi:hypothetical protein